MWVFWIFLLRVNKVFVVPTVCISNQVTQFFYLFSLSIYMFLALASLQTLASILVGSYGMQWLWSPISTILVIIFERKEIDQVRGLRQAADALIKMIKHLQKCRDHFNYPYLWMQGCLGRRFSLEDSWPTLYEYWFGHGYGHDTDMGYEH